MSQPVDPAQENSFPPIPLPPQQPQVQVPQPQAYGPVQQPGQPIPPAQYPGAQPGVVPQQPYPGYTPQPQQPYPGVPQQYAPAVPPVPAGPGILDLDFWLPKAKVLALIGLIVPPAISLISFIIGLIGSYRYFSAGTFFSFLFNLIEALVIGLVTMYVVLGIARILEKKDKAD